MTTLRIAVYTDLSSLFRNCSPSQIEKIIFIFVYSPCHVAAEYHVMAMIKSWQELAGIDWQELTGVGWQELAGVDWHRSWQELIDRS